jgi:hypothetical protein
MRRIVALRCFERQWFCYIRVDQALGRDNRRLQSTTAYLNQRCHRVGSGDGVSRNGRTSCAVPLIFIRVSPAAVLRGFYTLGTACQVELTEMDVEHERLP